MSEGKKLFLLDGMALIYRAHFAFIKNPRVTSKGLNTSAVFGFVNTLAEVLQKEKPTHIAVVFDTEAPTFRHEQFEAYKAHREEMPEDLAVGIPLVKNVLHAMNIPVITKDGFEADDIIGTLAKVAEKKGYEVYMMTPDKDFCQLVTKNVFVYRPARFGEGAEVLDIEKVKEKFSVGPDKVVEILALQGDAVDNIPGIPGIGEKTAKKLIQEFGSVDAVIKNVDEIKGDKLKENIKQFAKQGVQSRELATIHTAVPVKFDEEELHLKNFNEAELRKVFEELEFRTLYKRFFGEESQTDLFGTAEKTEETETPAFVSSYKKITDIEHSYHTVSTGEERKKLIEKLLKQKEICFDTETTSTDPNDAEIVGLSFSFKEHEAYYVPLPKNQKEVKKILEEFSPVFEDESIEKIGQNIKYDILVLKWYGIEVKGDASKKKMFDTMLAHYIIRPEGKHNMGALSEEYLHYTPIPIESLIGKGSKQLSMREVPVEKVSEYSAEDADVTFQIKQKLGPLVKKQNFEKLFYEVEMPLVAVLADMEKEGVKIDTNALKEYSQELGKEITHLEKEIYKIAGTSFNINSPKQLGEILFEKLKLAPGKKTKTGQYATGEDVLEELAAEHELPAKIVDFRQMNKLKSTYVDALPQLVNKKTGRIHTSFNQAVAATGRLSSNNPNLQNIPVRTERGREVRKAFVPRETNFVLLSADYSQIELRIMAQLSGDKGLIDAFKHGEDIHTSTVMKVFGVEKDGVTAEMRRQAKMINFGIIYGISAFGLSQRLRIPRKDAQHIIQQYFEKYPDVKKYMDEAIERARKNGYVETMLGRKRYLDGINDRNATVRGFAERNAINAPIQGSAADMIKVAMLNIHEKLAKEKLKTKMILQVHDELLFDVPKDEVKDVQALADYEMKRALSLSVPVEVGIGTGDNWLDAH